MDDSLQTRLKQCRELPSLPAVAARILDLANDPVADMGRVSDVVGQDPALATRLLQIANSPMYGQRRQSSSLHQAVMLLGLNSTLMLALSFSLLSSLAAEDNEGLDYDLFWRRALLASAAGRIIARQAGEASPEEVFLASLLQDVGIIVLDKALPDFYRRLHQQLDHRAIIHYEQQQLGCDHAEIGQWLLQHWHFPDSLVEATAASHRSDHQERYGLSHCVHLSGAIADALLAADLDQPIDPEVIEDQLSEEQMDAILAELKIQVPEIEKLFEISLLSGQDPDSMLAEAKEIMLHRSLSHIRELELSSHASRNIERRARDLEERSRRDHLTGLWNRGHLDDTLENEFARAVEDNRPLSVIFIDLDHFKQVNDNFGHHAGDEALKFSANLLSSSVRENDVVARFGGEEFVILLPGASLTEAETTTCRILRAFRNKTLTLEDVGRIHLTISAGIASCSSVADFERADALLRAADRTMYRAKLTGRDRLCVYGDEDKHSNMDDYQI